MPENFSRQTNQSSMTRNRARRFGGWPPKRYDFEDLVNYVLQVAEDVDPLGSSTYKETVLCSESA